MGGSLPADFRRRHHRGNDADHHRPRPAVFFRRLQIRVAQSRLHDWVGSPQSEFRALCLLPDRFCGRSLRQSSQLDAQLILIRRDRVPPASTSTLLGIRVLFLLSLALVLLKTSKYRWIFGNALGQRPLAWSGALTTIFLCSVIYAAGCGAGSTTVAPPPVITPSGT